ncbi:MAG: ABC transporter ATP-binding protein [Candidatus Krumholzibacteriia bacterium]
MAEPVAPIVRLEAVRKDYGEVVVTHAVDGVDFALNGGEFTALMGPSGSGKSTLLNLIGLLDRPTAGRVLLGGTDTAGLDDAALTRRRGREIGFVFQFHHLLPAFTALENVLLPGLADRGRPDPRLRERANELLRRVGLADRLRHRPDALSGGQQQRVAIARALAMDPPLVLADEPTGNLDTASADEVFALLREINRERGTAFLVVTHDRRMADRCDRIVELVDGRIVADSAGA